MSFSAKATPLPRSEGCYAGALAYFSPDLGWMVANPWSPYFSTVSMSATHYFDGTQWLKITY